MEGCCNLEVEVNGQETFVVDMDVIESFSGRFSTLFSGKLMNKTSKKKVIFNDFPGGAEGFEIMARFCYNNGTTRITPHNVVLLNCVANFMQMDYSNCSSPNLISQTENSLKGISYWSWSELLAALKQCQENFSLAFSSSHIVEKITDNVVLRLGLSNIASSCTSSSDSSSYRLSTDTITTDSKKTDSSSYSTTWWFEDLTSFDINCIERLVKKMLSQELDHSKISKFLVYYQRSRFPKAKLDEKRKILESMTDIFFLLDKNSVSCKSLFQIFQLSSGLKMSKQYLMALERLIGSKLDQVTVDQLLLPAPLGDRYAYDVNLVLRIIGTFLYECSSCPLSLNKLRNVGFLIDSYLEQVAPDSNLNPSKFAEFVTVLPDASRDSHDSLYKSIDMYLEVHRQLCEEEDTLRICSGINYSKLSAEILKQLARNSKFPSSLRAAAMAKCKKDETVKAYLRRIQKRILELERAYKTMQTQMANLMKPPKLLSQGHDPYLPKLCSA